MIKRIALLTFILTGLLFGNAVSGQSDIKVSEKDSLKVVADSIKAMHELKLASQLYQMGIRENNPIILLAAAEIAGRYEINTAEKVIKDPSFLSALNIIKTAKGFAADNPPLLLLLEAMAKSCGLRGDKVSVNQKDISLETNKSEKLTLCFPENVQAAITFIHHTPETLIQIFDEKGQEIKIKETSVFFDVLYQYSYWNNTENATFTIHLENKGPKTDKITIISN